MNEFTKQNRDLLVKFRRRMLNIAALIKEDPSKNPLAKKAREWLRAEYGLIYVHDYTVKGYFREAKEARRRPRLKVLQGGRS